MSQEIMTKLNASKAARWTALIIVSFTMMTGYFITDVMAPLEDMLETAANAGGLGWSSTEYGIFTSAYSWFNVFLLMLFFGGLILDKMGVRFTGLLSCGLMLAGTLIKWYAISPYFPVGGEWFGMNSQVLLAGLGFATFGVGVETAGITVSKVIVKWFSGYELALAMGLQVATARLGTAAALTYSLPIARAMGHVSMPVLMGALALCIGLTCYIAYCFMDRKLDASGVEEEATKEEGFRFSDVKLIITNPGFWLLALLCLLFYSGVFPFLKYATKLMIYKYQVDPNFAGSIPGLLPFGTIFLTPLFGGIYDRKGKGATLMIIGSLMLIVVHFLFAMPILNEWWFAVTLMIILGVAFSLVPSAMWPSVAKIIPMKYLGSAYALIFLIQNVGLGGVPALIGWIIDTYCTSPDGNINFMIPMLVFTAFGIVAAVMAILLRLLDKKKHYGLEQANSAKAE